MVRLIGWSVAIVVLVASLLGLRAVLMTTHDEAPEGSITNVAFRIETRGGVAGPDELARALLGLCQTRVRPVVVPDSFQPIGDNRYELRMTPALDRFDRREFEGCLEDRTISHVQGVVEQLEQADG